MDFHKLLFKYYTFMATASMSDVQRDVANLLWNKGQVCYEDIGCFSNDNRNPCKDLTVLPFSPKELGIRFYVYTPESGNGTVAHEIDYFDTKNITELEMDVNRPLYVVVHGYSQIYPFAKFLRPVRDILIEKGNNVMLVNWVAGADFPNYMQGSSNGRVIGGMIGNVLKRLDKHKKTDLDKTTLIGYSLGVHVAGFAGKALKDKPAKSIMALDPSYFQNAPPECRLHSTDAKFVQVIHCNGGVGNTTEFAVLQPLGHADFYFNGGRMQKACVLSPAMHKCSHDLSYVYFMESIRDASAAHGCKFKAYPCQNAQDWTDGKCFQCSSNSTQGGCPTVGYETSIDTRGIFYLDTLAENKTHGRYCGFQYALSLTSDVFVKGEISIILHSADHKNDTGHVSIFQNITESMEPSKSKTRIVVFPHRIKHDARLSLLYRKSVPIPKPCGPDSWNLTQVVLYGRVGGRTFRRVIMEPQRVQTGKPLLLNLRVPGM